MGRRAINRSPDGAGECVWFLYGNGVVTAVPDSFDLLSLYTRNDHALGEDFLTEEE